MIVAYIRVSTEIQSYEGQHYEIETWARAQQLTVDRWVQEKVSGTLQVERRTLGKLLKHMKRGDTLVITELSRLGRNLMMVMSILNTCSLKGIQIRSIKDGFELSESLNSKIIAFAFSLAAEIERSLISQRTREALAAKKKAGVSLGRPSGSSAKKDRVLGRKAEILAAREGGATLAALARELQIHPNTLSRYLREIHENTQNTT